MTEATQKLFEISDPNKHNKLIDIAERLMKAKHIEKKYINKYENYIGNIWFVTKEPKTILSIYIPDVIGWYFQQSIVFECKVSRNDFLADKKKKNKLGIFFII